MSKDIVDRAAGALLAPCAEMLGVPYEFASAPYDPQGPEPVGGGLGDYEPGEWFDDTQMVVCIARVAASGMLIDSPEGLDEIARGFLGWMADDPADVGTRTRLLLAPMGLFTDEGGLAAHDVAGQGASLPLLGLPQRAAARHLGRR